MVWLALPDRAFGEGEACTRALRGELLQIQVRPGELVRAQPGQMLILLGNVQELYVRVDIDEHDVPRYRPGSPATGYLRGQTDYQYALQYVLSEPKKSLTGITPNALTPASCRSSTSSRPSPIPGTGSTSAS